MGELFVVQKGRKREPFNVVIAGVPGIGKTSFATGWRDKDGLDHVGAPSALLVGSEETGEVETNRLPQARSYNDFVAQVDYLLSENCEVEYETLVVDTLDSVEKLLHEKILKEDPKQSGSMIAAHGGYGKAYEKAEHELIDLRQKFKKLRDEKKKNLIFIAHTKKVTVNDAILGLAYDSYELNLHQRAQSVFVDWVSAVLFANYIIHPSTGTNTDKIFASGDGERVLLTEKRPGHIGKNRFNLPYEMPLMFSEFAKYLDRHYAQGSGPSAKEIIEKIKGSCENISDRSKVEKIFDSVVKAGNDVSRLMKIDQKVKELVG